MSHLRTLIQVTPPICVKYVCSQAYLLFEGLSLEELGMRALERIPRDRAIDGIHAFQEMR